MNSTYIIQRNEELILELGSRWCSQTNTFVFPWGNATLTLEDMFVLGGFSDSGVSALSSLENDVVLRHIEERLEMVRIEIIGSTSRDALQGKWINKFKESGSDLEHAAFLTLWLSRHVFPLSTTHSRVINKQVIPVAAMLSRGIKVALGPVVLAMLYKDLGQLFAHLEYEDDVNICAPFQLVQIWAWERFPMLKPIQNHITDENIPRLARWSNVNNRNVIDLSAFIDSAGKEFLWCPYGLCFEGCIEAIELNGFDSCVQKYRPQLVAKQFGLDHDILNQQKCSTSSIMKDVKLENMVDDIDMSSYDDDDDEKDNERFGVFGFDLEARISRLEGVVYASTQRTQCVQDKMKIIVSQSGRSGRHRKQVAIREAEEYARKEHEERLATEEVAKAKRQSGVRHVRKKKRGDLASYCEDAPRESVSNDSRPSCSVPPYITESSTSPSHSATVMHDYMSEVSSSQQMLSEYYPHQQSISSMPKQHCQQQTDFSTFAQNPQDEPMDEGRRDQWRGTRPWPQPEYQEDVAQEEAGRPSMSRTSRSSNIAAIDPYMVGSAPGGPKIPTLMRSFTDHVAFDIYKGIGKTFSFQYRHTCLRGWTPEANTPPMLAAIAAGLDHIPSLMYDNVDSQLITAFVERWQPETNSFHLPFGEMTITLHDVHVQLMLNITGRGMGMPVEERLKGKTAALSKKLAVAKSFLGVDVSTSSISHTKLKERCESKTANSGVAGSGYLLHLLGSTLFPDKSQDKIPLSNIDYVRNLEEVGEWAWGAGLLAAVYRNLGKCSRADCKQISTCYTLILSWIYSYFPTLRAERSEWVGDMPFARMWTPNVEMRRGRNYRAELDEMTEYQVDWRPYGVLDFSMPNLAPSLFHGILAFGHDVTEPYMPDRVARQFGRVQKVPRPVISPHKAHRYRSVRSYVVEYTNSDWVWDSMDFHCIDLDDLGPVAEHGYEVTSDYMGWYIPHTHPYILPPTAEALGRCIQRVRGYLRPYYDQGEYQIDDMLEAIRRSFNEMQPLYYS